MGKSLIQTANPSTQAVAVNNIISLGSVQRRYGCNLRLSGNAIEMGGEGYFAVDAVATLAPNAVGSTSIALYVDGTPVPGAVATGSISTAGNSVTIPIATTLRRTCCEGVNNITVVLTSGASTVSNINVRIEKL